MECPVCFESWNADSRVPMVLKCGHSLCLECCIDNVKVNKLTCPQCLTEIRFFIEREFDESDRDFYARCIKETFVKNYALLNSSASDYAPAKPALPVKRIVDYQPGMICDEHSLPIHSYVEKPFSLACSECVKEFSEMKLTVKPIPQAANYLRNQLQIALKMLSEKKSVYIGMLKSVDSSQIETGQAKLQRIDEHFQQLKGTVNSLHTQAKDKCIEQMNTLKEDRELKREQVELCMRNYTDAYKRTKLIYQLPDEKIVSYSESSRDIEKKAREKVPNLIEDSKVLSLSVNRASYEALRENISNSFNIMEEDSSEGDWRCCTCDSLNPDGEVQCSSCKNFKALSMYPNLLKNPEQVTHKEIGELEQRRQLEFMLISKLDGEIQKPSVWYIINADWINEWKSFVFNKASPKLEQNSPNREIGTLPPGPISNQRLFTDPKNPLVLKKNLKPVAHYRGVNEKVWLAYLRIYGGGPPIMRKKLNIYGDIVGDS